MSKSTNEYATELVAQLSQFAETQHPGLLLIHWDDCDIDDRRFWFHFRAPRLHKVGQARSREMIQASRLVRACLKETTKFLAECPYTVEWSNWEAPRAIYHTIDGRKYFSEYETSTWIKVLAFYGYDA